MRSPQNVDPNEYDVFFSFLENTVMKTHTDSKTAPSRSARSGFYVSSIYAEWS